KQELAKATIGYFLSFDSGSRDLSDLRNMETICAGKNDWSEGFAIIFFSINVDDDVANDLDLLAVPQYGRNADHTG
ncbi:hypothetical protein CUMW_210550, partial [Citrus unshiu]